MIRLGIPGLGLRRPNFLVGAILASLALFIMPNSPVLWVAAGIIWILDASINVSMKLFRAFVGDNLSEEQRTRGFAMQSFFIGIAAYVASKPPVILTYFGVANTAAEGIIPDSVRYPFYIGGGAFFLAVLWTVIKSKEYTLEEMKVFEEQEKETKSIHDDFSEAWSIKNGKSHLMKGLIIFFVGLIASYVVYNYDLKKDLYVLTLGLISFGGVALIISGLLQTNKTKNAFVNIVIDFQMMPKVMEQLAWVQFFSWFALFSMWIYATAAVTEHIDKTTETTSVAYNMSANQVGETLANYNIIAAAVAFLLPFLAKVTSRKFTHFMAFLAGGLGLMSLYFITNPTTFNIEWLPMIGVGIAWASVLSVPYAMLSGSLPASKMGYHMGVFNFFIVISQLVAASILGFLVSKFFNNEPIYALLIGGCSMILAGNLSLFLNDKEKTVINE